MNVVISVGGKFHAIELAHQLERRGLLERIITTKRWYCKDKVDSRKCCAIVAPELIGQLVRRIPSLRTRGFPSYIKDNLFDGLARKYLVPCDIFHAWGNYAAACIPIARNFGAKVIIERGSAHPHYQDEILREECERHGVKTERAHPRIIEKGLAEIEAADAVIIPSEFVRRSFLARGVNASKLAMIPYGIDLSLFRAAEKTDNVFRLLFVGNIGVQKGVHYLLEAWKQLALPRAELVFIGSIEPGMNALLASYNGLFTYRGHVAHAELHKEYGNASAFILPSLQEGSALVTYEAMACGLPMIVSENTGSVVRDGVDGFVIPIRSVDAMKEKILWMYERQDQARAMGEAAREHVQQFTWDRYADEVVEVYRRLLNKEMRQT